MNRPVFAIPQMSSISTNDVHSRLNPCQMHKQIEALCIDDVLGAVESAQRLALPLAVCGGRHAMGGQQFAADGLLLDMCGMNRIIDFDVATGLIEVEAGIQWPALLAGYQALAFRDVTDLHVGEILTPRAAAEQEPGNGDGKCRPA